MPDYKCSSHRNSGWVNYATGLNLLEIMILLLDVVNDSITLGPGLAVLCMVSAVFVRVSSDGEEITKMKGC